MRCSARRCSSRLRRLRCYGYGLFVFVPRCGVETGRRLVPRAPLSEPFAVRLETSPPAVPPVQPCASQPPPSPCVAVCGPLRQEARAAVRLVIFPLTRVHPRVPASPDCHSATRSFRLRSWWSSRPRSPSTLLRSRFLPAAAPGTAGCCGRPGRCRPPSIRRS